MKSICVFCGAHSGVHPGFEVAVAELGRFLAEQSIRVVYGGGHVGLMGVLADAALEAQGKVIGVIPEALKDRELAHGGLTELEVVRNMHDRKATMARLSDGFIAAPGGIGTLEEIFEIWTWGQLGLHQKPLGFLQVEGYFDQLLKFLDHATNEEFIRRRHRGMVQVNSDPSELVRAMDRYDPPESRFPAPT
jgi:uncharacterized protein (TIGR00730 family)